MSRTLRHVYATLSILTGCAAEADSPIEAEPDLSARARSALQQAWGDPPRAPILPPTLEPIYTSLPADEDVRFIVNEGITNIHFADCVSRAPGQPDVVSDTALPVGGDRYLACTLRGSGDSATTIKPLMGVDGDRFCVFGSAESYRTGGDPRLTVSLERAPATGKWTLRATSEVPFQVVPVRSDFGSAWPLWVEVDYRVVDWKGISPGDSCDLVFRRGSWGE